MTPSKQESDMLVDAVLQVGKCLLERHGEFTAYGGLLEVDHSVHIVGVTDSLNSAGVVSLEALRRELRERVEAGEAIAAAIAQGVRVVPPGDAHPRDAIEVLVQHRDSYCADLFYPYRLQDRAVVIGHSFAQTCGKQILG